MGRTEDLNLTVNRYSSLDFEQENDTDSIQYTCINNLFTITSKKILST